MEFRRNIAISKLIQTETLPKSQTDDEWVVVPKTFCDLLIKLIELLKTNHLIVGEKGALKKINSIKKYL